MSQTGTRAEKTARLTLGVLTVISIVLLLMVIRPFASALFIAAVFAAALLPIHRVLTRVLRGKEQLAGILITLGLVLLVVLPLATLAVVLAGEVSNGVAYVRTTLRSEGVAGLLNDLPGPVRSLVEKILPRLPHGQEQLQEMTTGQGGRAAAAVGGVLSATWGVVMQLIVMLIAFFFLITDGRRLVEWLVGIMPLPPGQTRQLIEDFRRVSVTVLVSSVATAAIQAVVALAGYLIAGLPQPFFFAFVTFLVGLVPAVGAGAVGLFAALILFLQGHQGWALFLVLWAVIPVGLSDNVVKPMLIRGNIELHGAVVFFSLLGGLAAFGPIGLLAGPLVVSFFLAVVRMWGREPGSGDRREAAPAPAGDTPA